MTVDASMYKTVENRRLANSSKSVWQHLLRKQKEVVSGSEKGTGVDRGVTVTANIFFRSLTLPLAGIRSVCHMCVHGRGGMAAEC